MYTKETLKEMFESINEENYSTLEALAKDLKITPGILNYIRTKLENFGMKEEISKLEVIKEKSKEESKARFGRLCYMFKKAINFILKNNTELDYLLKYTWRTKKEFKDLSKSINLNLSDEEYRKVLTFFQSLEDMQKNHQKYPGITKSMILGEKKHIIGGYEITLEDKNLAMNYLSQTNCRWTVKLYNQAIRKVMIEKGVLG